MRLPTLAPGAKKENPDEDDGTRLLLIVVSFAILLMVACTAGQPSGGGDGGGGGGGDGGYGGGGGGQRPDPAPSDDSEEPYEEEDPGTAVSFPGEVIVYERTPKGASSGDGDVFATDPEGTATFGLATGDVDVRDPRISPDGKQIAYLCGGAQKNLCLMDGAGGNQRIAVNHPALTGFESPSWRRDGQEIAVQVVNAATGLSDIRSVRLAEGDVRKLDLPGPTVDRATVYYQDPDYASSSDRLVYSSEERTPDGVVHNEKIQIKGGGSALIAARSVTFSPNDKRLAFDQGGHGTIYMIGSRFRERRVFLTDGTDPAWSPDGTRIAFSRLVDGQFDLFAIAIADPTNLVRITDTPSFDERSPDWGVPAPIMYVKDTGANEDDGTGTFKVRLSRPVSSAVAVDYEWDSSGATPGQDYTEPESGTLTFQPGEVEKELTVGVLEDELDEPDEKVVLRLQNATGGAALSTEEASMLIRDNDAAPVISVNEVTVNEGETATLRVSLDRASGKEVRASYATESGTATDPDHYKSSSGKLIFEPGETQKTVTIDTVETISGVERKFTFKVHSIVNATSTAAEASVKILSDLPAISIGDASGSESTGVVNFPVTLSRVVTLPVSVSYRTVDGTASSATDFTATSGKLTFAPGETNKTIPVAIDDDNTVEPTETFEVELSDSVKVTLPGDAPSYAAQGTISDNDFPPPPPPPPPPPSPSLSISDESAAEGDAGTTTMTFDVTLSATSASSVTVDYDTRNGTAVAPGDYTATDGTLTFAAGDTTKTVSVTIIGDTGVEPTEDFFVDLSNASGATINDAVGNGTITNDDAVGPPTPPDLSISDETLAEGNAGTSTMTFDVTLSAASASAVTVDYDTRNGTAVAPGDYTATDGTLTFIAGDTSETVSVTINGDTNVELDEDFFVDLSNASGATINDAEGKGTITNDDAAGPPPPADPRIAFTVDGDLWVMDADGSDPLKIYESILGVSDPDWNQDGTKIVFSQSHDPMDGGGSDIYEIDPTAGAVPDLLIAADGKDNKEPTYSPTGNYILFSSNRADGDGDTDFEIYVYSGGTVFPQLTDNAVTDRAPAWHPTQDGEFVFERDDGATNELYVWSPAGGMAPPFPGGGGSETFLVAGSNPAWSPNGSTVAYSALSGGDQDLFTIPAAGGAATAVTTSADIHETGPSWSPDGLYLVFTQVNNAAASFQEDVYKVLVSDSTTTALAATDLTREVAGDWQPGP